MLVSIRTLTVINLYTYRKNLLLRVLGKRYILLKNLVAIFKVKEKEL